MTVLLCNACDVARGLGIEVILRDFLDKVQSHEF